MILAIFILTAIVIALSVLTYQTFKKLTESKQQHQSLVSKYGAIIDIEAHKDSLLKEQAKIDGEISALKNQYQEKREIFDGLIKELAIYNEEIDIAEWGFYKPHFDDFYDVDWFKLAIDENITKQKEQIEQEKQAFDDRYFYDKDLRPYFKRRLKVLYFAFNQACESAIANARWNNMGKMEQRIIKAQQFINKNAGEDHTKYHIVISQEMLDLKLEELRLAHEYEMRKKAEKDRQAEIRQQMREDAKLEEDLRKAEAEEEKYQKLLDKAKKEILKAVGDKEKELEAKIAMLTQELNEAHSKTERAKSLAEQTKRGHIYVISNIGSFGENVYKIGMTRRLDPQERVDELGDASVPFRFDVHALIYTEDAPTLEKSLHRELEKHQVNLVNYRKEFFKVELSKIQELVKKNYPDVKFMLTAEAKEYNESLAIRATAEKKELDSDVRKKFPVAI